MKAWMMLRERRTAMNAAAAARISAQAIPRDGSGPRDAAHRAARAAGPTSARRVWMDAGKLATGQTDQHAGAQGERADGGSDDDGERAHDALRTEPIAMPVIVATRTAE